MYQWLMISFNHLSEEEIYEPRSDFYTIVIFITPQPLSTCLYRTSGATKHRTGRTGPKYSSWVLVKCVWCGAYY